MTALATNNRFIPLCAPEIRGNEWKYVKECFDTSWVSTVGSYVDRFESGIADAVGSKYAVATNSGTAALHVALLVAGIKPDDEVLTSALTFIAPANAIRYVGAWPVFIDADPEYWQMDLSKLTDFVERDCEWAGGVLRNRLSGRRVSGILPVHILGHPVEMEPLLELARKYDLRVIEDASESLGAEYRGQKVGNIGEIACFSFNGNKLITTGGGGMIVTDNEKWAKRAKHLTTQAKDDPVEYMHSEIGFNYRLTNVQAAMGVAQLEMLSSYVEIKRRIAETYATDLQKIAGIRVMREAEWARSAFWMYTVELDEEVFGIDSRKLMIELGARGIQTRPLWQPLHESAAHANGLPADCPVAERLNREALSLPCSVGLSLDDQRSVIEQIKEIEANLANPKRSVTATPSR